MLVLYNDLNFNDEKNLPVLLLIVQGRNLLPLLSFTKIAYFLNFKGIFLKYRLLLQIVEIEMPFDKQKNQRKGFCFITFESEQVVADLLKRPKQKIKEHEVRPQNILVMFFKKL